MKRKITTPPVILVLRLGFAAVLCVFSTLVFFFMKDRLVDPLWAISYYSDWMEYILASLALVVLGAFLFDYLETEKCT